MLALFTQTISSFRGVMSVNFFIKPLPQYLGRHTTYNTIRRTRLSDDGTSSHHRAMPDGKCSFDIPFVPIVVFDNSADLKVHVENHIVVNRYNLNYAISQYRHAILNSSQVHWIVNAIEKHYTIADKQEIKRHKYNVHNRQYRAKTSIKQGVCPQCGGQLVLRQGRYGSFYGCSNYPKCKFTLNK